jgi:hypothetical protein
MHSKMTPFCIAFTNTAVPIGYDLYRQFPNFASSVLWQLHMDTFFETYQNVNNSNNDNDLLAIPN